MRKKGKLEWRKDYLAKFKQSHKDQMHDVKTRKRYGAGVALATAKKRLGAKLTAAAYNNKGAPREQLCFQYYHLLYCCVFLIKSN